LWLAAIALTLMVVALARPQRGLGRDQMTTEGVDIVIALDVSGSMAAEDFQPDNRLAVAKSVVADFIRRRTRDRLGLVIFAAAPSPSLPLPPIRLCSSVSSRMWRSIAFPTAPPSAPASPRRSLG
jgi:Ca-activated chloride channel family protein